MNEIYINGQKIELPKTDGTISIKDIKKANLSYKPTHTSFKNIIAKCDGSTLMYIKNVFKSLEGSVVTSKSADYLAYKEQHKQLSQKLSGYTVVRSNNDDDSYDLDVEEFSAPEVYSIEEEDFSIDNNIEGNNEVEYAEIYKKDPSQDNIDFEQSSLEKLQQISAEERVFTDELRITDNTLNLSNSISLDKIKSGNLNTKLDEKLQVNILKNRILEVGKVKLSALRNACCSFNKKLETLKSSVQPLSYKIKSGLICRYNQIDNVDISNSTIAQLPKTLAEKISTGSKNIASNEINKTKMTNQKLKEKLIKLKENLVNESNTELEHTKVM